MDREIKRQGEDAMQRDEQQKAGAMRRDSEHNARGAMRGGSDPHCLCAA